MLDASRQLMLWLLVVQVCMPITTLTRPRSRLECIWLQKQLASLVVFLVAYFPLKSPLPGHATWDSDAEAQANGYVCPTPCMPPHLLSFVLEILDVSFLYIDHNERATGHTLHECCTSIGKCRPAFDRMVFVLIDALRADLMFGAATAMGFVDRMRKRDEAFAFVANAQIPTVTMPRIKVCLAARIHGQRLFCAAVFPCSLPRGHQKMLHLVKEKE